MPVYLNKRVPKPWTFLKSINFNLSKTYVAEAETEAGTNDEDEDEDVVNPLPEDGVDQVHVEQGTNNQYV